MIKKSNQSERVVDSEAKSHQEHARSDSLRPKKLSEFIGQKLLKSQLSLFLEAAKGRLESVEHLLFYGPPGLGKTTLAMIISHEMDAHLISTSGPAIERQADLASLLTNLEEGDVLFIDEIHRLRSQVEEILYSAMEDLYLDIVIGKGPTARTMRIDLPPFTLVGATTKVGMVSAPLRDRFGSILKLDFYEEDEICDIVMRSAGILDFKIPREATGVIASCSRRTPRVANRLLRRVRDFAQIRYKGKVSSEIVREALDFLRVDNHGLDEMDRSLLKAIEEKFSGGPVGLGALCASLAEETQTLEDVYEPFLMQIGFIDRTPRGRVITCHGKKYLQGLKCDKIG